MLSVQTILQGDIFALRQMSTKVASFDTHLSEVLTHLTDTLKVHRGLGLAAPQIGIHQRVIVIDIGQGVRELINPRIVNEVGEMDGYESCLSFPNHTLKITRPEQIVVEAQDRTGESVQIEAADLLARVICHEIDHLNGILFIDHLSDEEIFQQLLESSFVADEADIEGEVSGNEDASESENENGDIQTVSEVDQETAILEELQLSSDMLSELSWKLILGLEIIKDYEDMFDESISWNELSEISDVLDKTINTVDSYIESHHRHPEEGGSSDES